MSKYGFHVFCRGWHHFIRRKKKNNKEPEQETPTQIKERLEMLQRKARRRANEKKA